MARIPLVSEDQYDALHDRLCSCGTPASALSCPLAIGIVGERCCQGCPDCMGVGSREQIKAMTTALRYASQALPSVTAEGTPS